MATNTAAIISSRTAAAGRAKPVLRELWQVPAFLAGALVLLSVCLARPPWQNPEERRLQRDLAEARRLLDQPGDAQPALTRAEGVLAQAERFPQLAGEAAFLTGSSYLRLAGRAEGPAAATHLEQARQHLERAEALGVPPGDHYRLLYRLGKACFHTGEKPQRVLEYLVPSVEQADDRAEAYVLLTQTYLRLPEPNLPAALEANYQLVNLPIVGDDVLMPARLLRGELLLALKDPAGARKALESVRPPAAPEPVLTRARQLLARTYQDEQRWSEAAQLWKELAARPQPPRELARTLCHLGVCHHQLQQSEDALRAWEKALEHATGEEEQAAALGVAELRLAKDPAAALTAFNRVVRDVQTPADWKNALADLGHVRERFEWACATCRQASNHETALRLAALYERIAAPGKAQMLYAQAAEEWARARQAAVPEDTLPPDLAEIHGLFCQAGGKYEAAADPSLSAEDRAERLWLAARCYLLGRDTIATAVALRALAKTGRLTEKVGEGWYRLAETHRAAQARMTGDEAKREGTAAQAAFRAAVNYPGKFAYRARYWLAMHKIANGDLDGAQADLLKNQALLAADMDREAHENTVFELANLLFYRGDYRQSISRLKNALDLYEDSARAPAAWYQLAECHRNLAEQAVRNLRDIGQLKPDSRAFYRGQYEQSLRDAMMTYEILAKRLKPGIQDGRLTEEEEALLRSALFATAECRYLIGAYHDAILLYTDLTSLCHNRVERLHALAGKRQCFWAERHDLLARASLDEIEKGLQDLPDPAFDEKVSRWSRKQWVDWIKDERKKDTQPLFNFSSVQTFRTAGLGTSP